MENSIKKFLRNYFDDGMLLSASDLTNMQDYSDSKRHLGYSSLIGYGIVCGLTVEISHNCIVVRSGLALDRQGREIYLPTSFTVSLADLFLIKPESGAWFLCLEYDEEPCGEAFVISEKKLRKTIHNRIRESFKFVAKRSQEDGDICVASFVIEANSGTSQISSVKSPVDVFHFEPIWERFLLKQSHGIIYVNRDEQLGEDGIFRTEEIYHGLGIGKDIGIELSVIVYDAWRSCEIYGDSQLFGLQVKTAAKLFHDRGTFVVAVKPEKPLTSPICIRWNARIRQEDS